MAIVPATKKSLAMLLSEALKEDRYDNRLDNFNSRFQERLDNMNDAQLAGFKRYMAPIATSSKVDYIKNAFTEKLGKTVSVLTVRERNAEQKFKEEQSVDTKGYDRWRRRQDKEMEKDMVIRDINRKAKAEAAEEMEEAMKKRKAQEKERLMSAIPEAELLQQKYIIAGLCCFVFLLTGAIVTHSITASLILLLCLIFVAFFFSGFIFYYAYYAGIVLEEEIPEEEFQMELGACERRLIREKMTAYNTRRAKIKAAEKADREHRRKMRAERKEKEAIRKEIEEAEKREFLRLAREEIANAKKAMKGKKKPSSSEGGAVAAAAAAGLDIEGLENEEDAEDSDGYEGLFNDIEDVDAVHEIPMDDKLKKKRKKMPADPPLREDTGKVKMQVNICEITILNIRPYISDNSSLYARACKVTYHIPRGKRHRVGENTVLLTTDVLANVGDEISWTIVNTEKTIQTVAEQNISGQDPNDDFCFDESSIRARGQHIKAQSETFSSAFFLGDEEEIVVEIIKQWKEDEKSKDPPLEALIGTASIVGGVVRDFVPEHDDGGSDGDDRDGGKGKEGSLDEGDDDNSSIGSLTIEEIESGISMSRNNLTELSSLSSSEVNPNTAINNRNKKEQWRNEQNIKLESHKEDHIAPIYVVRDIARQDLYGFASIHFALERKFVEVNDSVIEDEIVEDKDHDFHQDIQPIQTAIVSIDNVRFRLKGRELEADTKSIILSVELRPPDMGFYGPSKKHVGFKGAPGPEETLVILKSIVYMKDNTKKVDCDFEFVFTQEEILQNRHISVDHTICFVLEEETAVAEVPEEEEGEVVGVVSEHNFTENQLGEQLFADVESGLIKPKHIVLNRQYIGGYEIPIHSVMNGQKWYNDRNESVYNVDGIFVDSKLKSIGMMDFEARADIGDLIYHSHK